MSAADGGLRLRGILTTEVGSSQDDDDIAQMAAELARTGKLCK